MVIYVALLRGINVGGNNIIKMSDLKLCLEENGFETVTTFIQSGNVIFTSDETDSERLEENMETLLGKRFSYRSKVMVRSLLQMHKILQGIPLEWKNREDVRCYIAFLKNAVTPQQVSKEIELAKGIDKVKTGPEVIYMTSLLSKLTKSKLNKIASSKIYQEMTIRNYNTSQKITELMKKLVPPMKVDIIS